jgi:hypothetical protein
MASSIVEEPQNTMKYPVGFEHERIATPEALEYSAHIWEVTSIKQRIAVYSMLANNVKTAIDALKKDGLLTGFQENSYGKWEAKCNEEVQKWRRALQVSTSNSLNYTNC